MKSFWRKVKKGLSLADLLVCIAIICLIVFLVTKISSWRRNLSEKEEEKVVSLTKSPEIISSPRQSVPRQTIPQSVKQPGKNLKWGDNNFLKKGDTCWVDCTLTFKVKPATSSDVGAKLYYKKKGFETMSYWEIWFEEDGSSSLHNNHDDESFGNYYFIPDRDVQVNVIQSN